MQRVDGSSRFFLRLFLVFCAGALVCAGCQKEEEQDECEGTKKPLIEPMFRIHVSLVNEADQTPYAGAVSFQSEKHYCDGTTSGLFTDQAQIQNGFWKPITTQYKLENTEDFVLVTINAGEYELTTEYVYQFVKDNMVLENYSTWVLEDTIAVAVP